MKHPYKKSLALLALASMLVLTSCGAVPTNEDPTAIMKEARSNLVTELTSSIDKDPNGTSLINFEGTASASGITATFNGSTDAKSAYENDTANSSVLFKLNAAAEVPTLGNVSGALEAELRTFGQKLYMKLASISAESANAELDAQIKQMLPLVSMYSAKWFKIDQETLAQMSEAGSAAVQSLNKDEVKALIAELNNHEIFTLEEKLAPANGNFAYKVRLNADGIASLIQAVNARTNPTTPLTEADLQEIKDNVATFNNEKGLTHTLYIDAASKKYKKFETTGTVEGTTITSVLEAPKAEAMKWVASIESTDSTTNTTQSVKIDLSSMDGKTTGKILVDIPGASPVKADISINGTYNKNKVAIEEPTDATDLTETLGSNLNTPATATGAAMQDTTMTSDQAAIDAALENAMGE